MLPDDVAVLHTPDSSIYLELRDNLLSQGGFLREDGAGGYVPEIERVPGYPLFLAALSSIAGSSEWAIVSTQAVLGAITAVLIALLGMRVNREMALVSGLFTAAWPNEIVNGALVLNDSLFLTLFSGSLVVFAFFSNRPTFSAASGTGLLFGLSLIVRPLFQFLPPLLALIIYLTARRNGSTRPAAAAMGMVFLVATLAPATPTIMRNLENYGTPSLTAQAGTHLMGWVVPLVAWHAQGVPYDTAFETARKRFLDHLDSQNKTVEELGSFATSQHRAQFALHLLSEYTPVELAEAWIKGAIVNMGAPAIALDPRIRAARSGSLMTDAASGGWMGRLSQWWSTAPAWANTVLMLGIAGSIAVSILQLIGFLRLWPTHVWACVLGVGLAAYVLLIMGPVVGTKYRLPFAPVEILFSAYGLLSLIGYLRWKREKNA